MVAKNINCYCHWLFPGHYAFIEASPPRQTQDNAWLQSPVLEPTPAICMSFWFNMFGEDTGSLNVKMRPITEDAGSATEIWSLNGDRGQGWNLGRIAIYSSDPFYVSDTLKNIPTL